MSVKSKSWWARDYEPTDLVVLDGTAYIPFAYRMDFLHGEVLNVAILHDVNANSEVYADVERIEEYKNE